jgi:GAF domain-containing protein
MIYVPELEEERFQSMAAVPLPARSGEVLGVIVLHTVAPREFDADVLNFLGHTASLVAGAIENARLYEDARRRVDALTNLAALSQEIVAVTGGGELYPVVTDGVRRLLGSDGCQVFLRTGENGDLELVASDPPGELPEARAEVRAALRDDREQLGELVVLSWSARDFREEDQELLQAVANQVALALRKAELIERLAAENLVRDLFEALAAGALDVAEARARAAGADLDRAHVFVHVRSVRGGEDERPWPALANRVEARLRTLDSGTLCDVGRDSLRALLPLRGVGDAGDGAVDALTRSLHTLALGERVLVGVSSARAGARGGGDSLGEAADAGTIAGALSPDGGALAYRDLGAYRYLVHLPLADAPHDRLCEAVDRLMEYDDRRRTQLTSTLEQYLADRRSGATTARKLFIHPNTLRQRLDRIEKLADLDLASEDLLALELALKLVRLRRAGGGASRPTP